MPVHPKSPRWKVGSAAEVAQLAADVSATAVTLKKIMQRATTLQSQLAEQMGGSFSGMSMLLRPMRMLESASEKVDEASWALQEFAEKIRKVSL
jgi:hypothetical protein